ncbi:hypothetical protein STAS_06822 [Striga asiatica]|uniref:Uncharacterized protein n=1 Tax=Striga asiatica TaxID=4170 RepID=A0A5A7PD51_STRAF|nr:hypothetical protein STAS_06822 [Striga asiatica]
MAKSLACLFFALVILSINVFHIEARNLKVARYSNSGQVKHLKSFPSPDELRGHRIRLDEEYPNTFRPTNPGPSPGIGHSKLDEGSAFRPTNPGPSPGIGHPN